MVFSMYATGAKKFAMMTFSPYSGFEFIITMKPVVPMEWPT